MLDQRPAAAQGAAHGSRFLYDVAYGECHFSRMDRPSSKHILALGHPPGREQAPLELLSCRPVASNGGTPQSW